MSDLSEIFLWVGSAIAAFGVAYALAAPFREAQQNRALLAVLFMVPSLALALYLYLGNPQTPDQPLTPRLEGALSDLPPAAIMARLENEIRLRPQDVEGWRLLARLRTTVGQPAKAGDAWQRVIELTGETQPIDTQPIDTEAHVGLAQSLIEQDGGVVNEVAVALLDSVLQEDSENLLAQFWRAQSWAQQGEDAKARAIWQNLRANLPDEAPLAKLLDKQISQPN
jgi:cytochrome c-type biogenesis protein CcmH